MVTNNLSKAPNTITKLGAIWTALSPCRNPSKKPRSKTYNTRDSPVVTHPSTSLAIICLSMGERTGSRVFRYLWSYVTEEIGY